MAGVGGATLLGQGRAVSVDDMGKGPWVLRRSDRVGVWGLPHLKQEGRASAEPLQPEKRRKGQGFAAAPGGGLNVPSPEILLLVPEQQEGKRPKESINSQTETADVLLVFQGQHVRCAFASGNQPSHSATSQMVFVNIAPLNVVGSLPPASVHWAVRRLLSFEVHVTHWPMHATPLSTQHCFPWGWTCDLAVSLCGQWVDRESSMPVMQLFSSLRWVAVRRGCWLLGTWTGCC